MSAKKWLIMFAAVVVLAFLLCVGFNILVDPFGVFGDKLFRWDSYSQTNNPRVAKIEYLDEHHDEYDSYIIGSSSAASYDPELLNAYTGARFYNLFVYGCDTGDYSDFAHYLIENYEVRNLILNIGINEAAPPTNDGTALNDRSHYRVTGESKTAFLWDYAFANPKYAAEKVSAYFTDTELPQVFDVFRVESGCYDKRLRDVERIGDLERYMGAHGSSFTCEYQSYTLPETDTCIRAVEEIRSLCEENGVKLTVIFSPVYYGQWEKVDPEALTDYKTALAEVTDYWDFSLSSISMDARYFYDDTHFRNAVGSMVLAKIYADTSVYMPEDFGRYVTHETAGQETLPDVSVTDYTVDVPILMYHHFAEEGNDTTVITPETFRAQLEAIQNAGYTAVSMQELYDYVYHGTELPEKPFCITIDDGYLSNYEIAYPILRELGMKATVFSIGFSFGSSVYKDTAYSIIPHFDFARAAEMMDSGVISVQSHTYDMHQWAPYESSSRVRENMSPLSGESEAEFIAAIVADATQYRQMYGDAFGSTPIALAYPAGVYSDLTEVVLHENGFPITLSTDTDRRNTLVKGLPQTLYALCRLNVTEAHTPEELLSYLENGKK